MENNFLKDRNILFICQKFYDYHQKIIAQLESFGAHVVFYENKMFREDPALHPGELISNVKRVFNPNYKNKYADRILNETINERFDLLFCIGGFSITAYLVEELKRRNDGIKTVLYFWDSFKVWPFQSLIESFDVVYSFDRSDCQKYKLNYLPLFYSEDDTVLQDYDKRDIDVLYVGSVGPASKNRFKIIAQLQQECEQNNLNSFLYLLYMPPRHNALIKAINTIRKLFDLNYRSFISELNKYQSKYAFVHTIPLSSKEIKELLYRAKSAFDITVPGQIGLTMRSIETLHMGCKLLTTNPYIKVEDFFDREWIRIIKEDEPKLDLTFLRNKPRGKINIEYLSLENWLEDIIKG